MKICSNTIVKNGMPFIVPVIENVLPVVHRALITVSTKSDDGTIEALGQLVSRYPDKVKLYFESVKHPDELTQERQKLLEKTYEDWVLFLDDDDWWNTNTLKECTKYLSSDIDGLAISPIQVVDEKHHDNSWYNKFFTKFFRNTPETHYKHPWPRDLIYKGSELLYWKTNPAVPRVSMNFFHLSYIKDHSFRNEDWANKYKFTKGKLSDYSPEDLKDVKRIFSIRNK